MLLVAGLAGCGLTTQKPSEVIKPFGGGCIHDKKSREFCITDTPGSKDAVAEQVGIKWEAFDGHYRATHRGVSLKYSEGFLGMAELVVADKSLSEFDKAFMYQTIFKAALNDENPQKSFDATQR